MKSFTVDTNFFLRFLLKDVPEQYEVIRGLLHNAKKDKVSLIVPQIIIFEITFSLEKYYKFSKTAIVESLKSLLAAPYFQIQDREVFKKAVELFKEYNISFPDCFLIYFAKNNKADLFTFDRGLKKLISKL